MKYILKISFLLALFSNSFMVSVAQVSPVADSTKQKFMAAAKEIMTNAHFCNLISLDENNRPVGRIVEPFEPDSNFIIWMGTNSFSRKVQQIKKNPNVTLFYYDVTSYAYVCIQGKAEMVNDSLQKTIYWKEEWMPFYPNDKKNYTLIKFTPLLLDILSPMHGFSGDSITWKTPSLELKK